MGYFQPWCKWCNFVCKTSQLVTVNLGLIQFEFNFNLVKPAIKVDMPQLKEETERPFGHRNRHKGFTKQVKRYDVYYFLEISLNFLKNKRRYFKAWYKINNM